MNISEYEFYEDYLKRREIEISGILLGVIDNPTDIKLYHELYQDLQSQFGSETAYNFANLLKKYGIEIHVVAKTKASEGEGWHFPIWHVLKDNQLIAEI